MSMNWLEFIFCGWMVIVILGSLIDTLATAVTGIGPPVFDLAALRQVNRSGPPPLPVPAGGNVNWERDGF
jgi:hypothetical protein